MKLYYWLVLFLAPLALPLVAQRGLNTPFVGTGTPTVSFSALSSNAIYSMIITYGGGGGGGGWTGNPNQFDANGSYTNIKSGPIITNINARSSIIFYTTSGADDVTATPGSGGTLTLQSSSDPWGTPAVFSANGLSLQGLTTVADIRSSAGIYIGNGYGLTNLNGSSVNLFTNGFLSVPSVAVGTAAYSTNLSGTSPNFTNGSYQTLTTNNAFVWLAPSGINTARTNVQVIMTTVTNSAAAVTNMTAPANVIARGTWNVTNITEITWKYDGSLNVTSAYSFPVR